jgi:hypothetical protein
MSKRNRARDLARAAPNADPDMVFLVDVFADAASRDAHMAGAAAKQIMDTVPAHLREPRSSSLGSRHPQDNRPRPKQAVAPCGAQPQTCF